MPKKLTTNSKSEESRARKLALESEKKDRESREQEDRYWTDASGPKSRAAKKREEDSEKRAQIAARRAENRQLAEKELLDLEKAAKKPDPKANRVAAPAPKVTAAELGRGREEERERLRREAEAVRRRRSRTADEEEYERVVLVGNTNREEGVIEAHSVDEAIARMSVGEGLGALDRHPERRLKASFKAHSVDEAIARMSVGEGLVALDRHPERRLKASFKAFEEVELARLKEEKPGLTLTQYRDMVWKLWKKSPDNPLNQQASE